MEMTGEYRIAAPRETVWRALNDPDILRQAIPGCESIEKQSDTEMTAKATLQIGPVKAKFAGKVTLSNLDPPNGYTIGGEGQGGVAGFAKGGADVRLDPDGDATILRYSAKATVGGKLAQLGARLIDATAAKLAAEFFARFSEVVAPKQAALAAGPTIAAAPMGAVEPATSASAAPTRPTLPPALWITLLVLVVGLLLWYFAAR